MRRIHRHHVVLSLLALVWLGYMLRYGLDSFATTFDWFFNF